MHIGGKIKNLPNSTVEKVIASLHSLACNLGPMQTSRSTRFSEKQIINAKKYYLSENNLRRAIVQIVNLYNKLNITNYWGDGSSVSADGRLIKMVDKNLLAAWNVKYHSIGGMLYTHVSDKYIAIYSQFINCGVYEAEYLLDALFDQNNDIDIKPTKVHADTHGQTELMFAFCYLLGIRLMPRIRNMGRSQLYKPSFSYNYGHIDRIFKHAINWSKIYAAYYDLLRICASIRYGKVKSSLIFKKITSTRKLNKIYEGFMELGRVIRTIYILEYASSKELRRIVQLGCNKSEMWHNLQKFVYFGQSGEMRTNDPEEQNATTTALELVADLIVYENAKMIAETVDKLKNAGEKIKYRDIKYITPFITSHINRYGRFEFDLEIRKVKGNEQKNREPNGK